MAYYYGATYEERAFDNALLRNQANEGTPLLREPAEADVDMATLMAENAALKEELTARRAEQQQTYVPKPLDLSEYKTRKLYIDAMLLDAGWTEGRDLPRRIAMPA